MAYLNLGDAYLMKAGEKEKAKKAFTTCLELALASSSAARVREALKQM